MKRWAIMTILALGLAGAGAAAGQPVVNSNAPIDITADAAEVINSECSAVWRGAAEALQGDTRLRANVIKVFFEKKGPGACGGTRRLEADGNVFYVTPTQSARGDHAVYDAAADSLVLTGNVIIVQGRNVARGDRLTVKVSTREARMESTARPGGARVRGVFYPDQGGAVGPAGNR